MLDHFAHTVYYRLEVAPGWDTVRSGPDPQTYSTSLTVISCFIFVIDMKSYCISRFIMPSHQQTFTNFSLFTVQSSDMVRAVSLQIRLIAFERPVF